MKRHHHEKTRSFVFKDTVKNSSTSFGRYDEFDFEHLNKPNKIERKTSTTEIYVHRSGFSKTFGKNEHLPELMTTMSVDRKGILRSNLGFIAPRK